MRQYLIETRHTARECIWAAHQHYDDFDAFVARFAWGCKDGDHSGWAIVEAVDKFEAQSLVPRPLHPKTRIVELNGFTPEEGRAFHEGLVAAVA